MATLNKVFLIGNLTQDPQIRFTPKGAAICNFDIAVNRRYTADNGEKRDEVTYVSITAWKRTAELVEKYCKRGSAIHVEGRLHMETWTDKQSDQKRSKLIVVAEDIQFLSNRPKNAESKADAPADEEEPF